MSHPLPMCAIALCNRAKTIQVILVQQNLHWHSIQLKPKMGRLCILCNRLQQSQVPRPLAGGYPVLCLEFAVDVLQVVFDRVWAESEFLGNLFV
jgi:hypothetical protein